MRLPGPSCVAGPASGQETGDGADARRMSGIDQVSCCACWPGVRRRAVKAEPALTPGRGGAQRSRLDLNTAQFGSSAREREPGPASLQCRDLVVQAGHCRRVGVPPEDDTRRPKPSEGFPCWYAHETVGPQQLPGPSWTMVYRSAASVVAELISPALINPGMVASGTQLMRLDSKSSSGAPMRVALSAR